MSDMGLVAVQRPLEFGEFYVKPASRAVIGEDLLGDWIAFALQRLRQNPRAGSRDPSS